MLTQNLRTYLKHLRRNKMYTIITLSGFAISLAFIILLSIYIQQETSVDQFHRNKDRIYRLAHEGSATFAPVIGKTLQEKYPEIESFVSILEGEDIISSNAETHLRIDYLFADSTFFNIFSFPLDEGTPETALKSARSIVLSRSLAHKLFGNESPMGQQILLDKDLQLTVTGVMKDLPKNTHFQKREAIVSLKAMEIIRHIPDIYNFAGQCDYGLYFLAKKNSDLPSRALEILESFKKNFWLYKQGHVKKLYFEPLTDVYFSESGGPGIKQQSKKRLTILSGLVILILIIAIINYINLTIAQSGCRSKEIVMKKIMGSGKGRLLTQFITESILLCFVAYILSVLTATIMAPLFSNVLNTHLDLSQEFNPHFIAISLLSILAIGTISGLIPAIIITRLNPLEVMKGSTGTSNSGIYAKGLISLQFCIAIILLICATVIWKQTIYMQNYNPGFNKDNLVWMEYGLNKQQKQSFKDQLKTIPGVIDISYTAGSPIDGGNNNSFDYNGKPVGMQIFTVDSAFFNIFDIHAKLTGVAWSIDAALVNRATINILELDSIPKEYKQQNQIIPIYGVVNDFHFRNLKEKVSPAVIKFMGPGTTPWNTFVKIGGKNQMATFKKIKQMHQKFTGGIPPLGGFVDQKINSWYKKEKDTALIITYFTILSIILSVMGILAMSTYYLQQKIKEIGIRKANGASVRQLVIMLNMDFLKWILLAFIIACPIAYSIMSDWLTNFAYTTDISWWVFAVSAILALLVGWITVGWQTYAAATQNPVQALKYE